MPINPRILISLMILTWGLTIPPAARAYPDGFGPYHAGEEPKAFPYKVILDPGWNKDHTSLDFKLDTGSTIHYEPESGKISFLGSQGQVLARVGDFDDPNWGSCVLEGDFNRDGKPDFAVMFCNGGNGLDAEMGQWIFFLSAPGPDSFKAVMVNTDSIGVNDVIDAGKDGSLRLIQTTLLNAPESVEVRPGEQLYFWLYRLLVITGTDLAPDDSSDNLFPKMVAYARWAEQQNHKETKLLTAVQKRDLIKANPIRILRGKELLGK